MPIEISAARYNSLQSRVNAILGTGSGTSGYGQSVTSSQVVGKVGGQITASTDLVSAADMLSLYIDMVKIRRHQSGLAASLGIDTPVAKIDLVSDTTAPTNNKGITEFESFMSTLEANKFNLDLVSEASVTTEATNTRLSNWNGTVTHGFLVRFASANARRWFFNSGGQIYITPSADISSIVSPNLKTSTWAGMVNGAGTVKFNYTETTTTAALPNSSITTTNIGNYDLTSSFQTIYVKTVTGTYANIDYTVQARANSSTEIEFRCQFKDDSETGPYDIDELVSGIFSNTVQFLRATGNNVQVANPQYVLTTDLETGGVTVAPPPVINPTYGLSRSAPNVNEGGSVTITLTTTNVIDGTTVPFTISGVSSSDIGGATLSNFFTVFNNTASKTYVITADSTTEGSETLTLSLTNGAASTTVLINDTSQGAAPPPSTPGYSISTSSGQITEGGSATFTVSTSNVPNGTVLYWTTTGTATANDFTDGVSQGVISISGGTASITRTTNDDATVESDETFAIQLRSGSYTGTILATSNTVTIVNNDASAPVGTPNWSVSPTSDSSSIFYSQNAIETSTSFTVTNNGSASGTVTLQEISRPTGGSTTITPSTFTLAAGANRGVLVRTTSPAGLFNNTQFDYSFAVLGAQSPYPTFTATQTRTNRTLSISPTTATQGVAVDIVVSGGEPGVAYSITGDASGSGIWDSNGQAVFPGTVFPSAGVQTYTVSSYGCTTATFNINVAAPAAPAPPVPTASISFNPTSGFIGDSVTCSWSSSDATSVFVAITSAGSTVHSSTSANGSHTFTASGTAYGASILATNSTGSANPTTSATFTTRPSYQIEAYATPNPVSTNGSFSIFISGCAPNDTITYSGESSGTITANASGEFAFLNIFAPGTARVITWFLTTGQSGSATITLQVVNDGSFLN